MSRGTGSGQSEICWWAVGSWSLGNQSASSIHSVFFRNCLYLGHTGVTSFSMHFEKVGRGLLREAKRREREGVELVKAKGIND